MYIHVHVYVVITIAGIAGAPVMIGTNAFVTRVQGLQGSLLRSDTDFIIASLEHDTMISVFIK